MSRKRETHLAVEAACLLAPKYPVITVDEFMEKLKINKTEAKQVFVHLVRCGMAFKAKRIKEGFCCIHPSRQGKTTKYNT
jgi:predicted transcriptional regulator